MASRSITKSEVKQFISDWFRKLDRHPNDINEITPFVEKSLIIEFAEEEDQPFRKWYESAAKFRNQSHSVKALNINIGPDRADVRLIVRWERSDPELEVSKLLQASYAAQTWTLIRSQGQPGICIKSYRVDYLLDEIL